MLASSTPKRSLISLQAFFVSLKQYHFNPYHILHHYNCPLIMYYDIPWHIIIIFQIYFLLIIWSSSLNDDDNATYFVFQARRKLQARWYGEIFMFTLSLRLPLLSLSIMSKRALISSSWAPSALPGPLSMLLLWFSLELRRLCLIDTNCSIISFF